MGGIYSLDRIDQPPGPVHDLAMLLTRVVNRAAMRLRDPTPVRVAVVATLLGGAAKLVTLRLVGPTSAAGPANAAAATAKCTPAPITSGALHAKG
jgi:hypothetical protein